MAKYYTKCGHEFQKSSKAVTTGYRLCLDIDGTMERTSPSEFEKCVQCPYKVSITEGYGKNMRHRFWECRAGSKPPNHTSEPIDYRTDTVNVLHIHTLDEQLFDQIKQFAESMPGFNFMSYNADCQADCRRTIAIAFAPNKTGKDCRAAILRHFWPEKFPDTQPAEPAREEPQMLDESVQCEYAAQEAHDEEPCQAYCTHNDGCALKLTTGRAYQDILQIIPAGRCIVADKMAGRVPAESEEVIPLPNAESQLTAFDYTQVDTSTAEYLQDKARTIASIRIRSMLEVGRELAEVHDRLARGRTGVFGEWVESIGLTRRTAEMYIQAVEYIAKNFRNIDEAEAIQPSLLMAMSRPSAPVELQEAVKSGEIDTITEWKKRVADLAKRNEELATINRELAHNNHVANRELKSTEEQLKQERTKPDRNAEVLKNEIDHLKSELNILRGSGSPQKVLSLEAELANANARIKNLQTEMANAPIVAAVSRETLEDSEKGKLMFELVKHSLEALASIASDPYDAELIGDHILGMGEKEKADSLQLVELANLFMLNLYGRVG